MNRLRGLMAVFMLLFLLSGISLLLLVIDDKKDLSSRANLAPTNTITKPIITFPQADTELVYSPDTWLKIEETFYVNQNNADSLRLFDPNFNSSSISAILGSEFTNRKLIGINQVTLTDWTLEKYTYNLFGETKKVNLWKNKSYVVLEVGPLKNSLTNTVNFLIKLPKEKSVLGVTTGPDDSAKIATLVRPSVVMILNHYCAELKFFSAPEFTLSDKIYPYCLTSVGTGFFISNDGLVATNGHIVKNFPRSALFYGISSGKLDSLLTDFLGVYFSQINKKPYTEEEIKQKVKEAHANKEVLYQLGGMIADLNQKNILKFQNEKNNYYLQVGNQGAELTDTGVNESDGVVKANLLDIDYQEPNEQTGFNSSDVALLKTEKGNFPALLLGSLEDAYVGSNLQVIGFPATAMSAGALLDTSSTTEPTFTKGVVSAIKLAKGNQKKLIQTDAIINHGNSGGPALLLNGKVIGIATYGVTAEDSTGAYNFLRDIQDIKDLVTKQKIVLNQGDLYHLWQDGLNDYWLGYFKYSSEKFQKIINLYPSHPLAGKYLESSNIKINTVEDNTPKFTHPQRSFLIFLSVSVMATSTISFTIILYLIYLQKQKNHQISNAPTF